MRRLSLLVLCSVLLALNFSCEIRSVPGDSVADERQIRDLEIAASEAIAAKDLDRFISLYSDDAQLYDDHSPGIRGVSAIRKAWKAEFARSGLAMRIEPQKVEISSGGDLAWAHGIFESTTLNAAGKPMVEPWQYAQVYKKQPGGRWTIHADNMYCGLRSHLFPAPPERSSTNAPIAPLIGLACFACAIWFLFGMPVVAVVSVWKAIQRRKLSIVALVSLVMLLAFFLVALLLWNYISAHYWNLSFGHALRAAGDTARYGNPVEDTAEDVLVFLLVLSTLSAAAAGLITGIGHRIWIRRRRSAVGYDRF